MFASSFIRWSLHFQSNRSYYWSIARQPYFAGLEPGATVLADSVAFALYSAGLHILDSSFACFAHVGSQVLLRFAGLASCLAAVAAGLGPELRHHRQH